MHNFDPYRQNISNEHAGHVFVRRNVQFFGDAGQLKVHRAFVVVVGLGGVGSHAAAMLLRSGVGKLRLIDFDQVGMPSKVD